MQTPQELARENAVLRERIAKLSSAMLRVTSTLDVKAVLHEIVESARSLSDARYGIIVTTDVGACCGLLILVTTHVGARTLDFVTSGLTAEEQRQMADWPDGPKLFEHFATLQGPLRLDDLRSYVRELGFATDLMYSRTLQAVPLRHREALVGTFFLGEKAGGLAFTDADQELLLLFAAQAATAVANATAHGNERRARADLEALIDTTPVGVVVFDAGGGKPVSFNREAERIVDALRTPGRPVEALLDEVTCHRADGTEAAFGKFPFAQSLDAWQSVRGEKIVLSVPDGRCASMLVNCTPIRAEHGTLASVVVTMQDLAPLEQLERQRTEFLSLVSHELRAPLSAIKGSAATVLGAGSGVDPVEMREFFRIVDEQADNMRSLVADLLDAGRIEAGTLSVCSEPTEVAALVDLARHTFANAGGRHPLRIDLPSDLPPVAADPQRIVQVLNNLLANAARHAPERSPILIDAALEGPFVALSVSDRGAGIPANRLPHLFEKHMGRTGNRETAGLGLAICKGLVEAHGGRIRAESPGTGQGSRLTFTLPVATPRTVAIPDKSGHRGAKQRILVLDDDPQALAFVRNALSDADFVPIVAADPAQLPRLIRHQRPHLVLLDLMFRDTDGIELLDRVPELADQPVIFISAYGRDETIARALEAGAVDYVVKPFSPAELVARIRAVLRRQAEPEPFHLQDLVIRYEERRATLAGEPLVLTATEYELLRVLSTNAGRVTTFEALRRQVWSKREHATRALIRTFVMKLRHKLEDDPSDPAYIVSERGVGYRMLGPEIPLPR